MTCGSLIEGALAPGQGGIVAEGTDSGATNVGVPTNATGTPIEISVRVREKRSRSGVR